MSSRLSSSSSILERVYVIIPFLAILLLISILISNIHSGQLLVDSRTRYDKSFTYTGFYGNQYTIGSLPFLNIRENIYVSGCLFSQNNSLVLNIIYMPSSQSSGVINVTIIKVKIHGVEHYIGLNINKEVNMLYIPLNNIEVARNSPVIVWLSVYDKLFYRVVFIKNECRNIYYRK